MSSVTRPTLSAGYRALTWPSADVQELHHLKGFVHDNPRVIFTYVHGIINHHERAHFLLTHIGILRPEESEPIHKNSTIQDIHLLASLSHRLVGAIPFCDFMQLLRPPGLSLDTKCLSDWSSDVLSVVEEAWAAVGQGLGCCNAELWSHFQNLTSLLEQRITQQAQYLAVRNPGSSFGPTSTLSSGDESSSQPAASNRSMMSELLDSKSMLTHYHPSICFWLRVMFNGQNGINLRNLVWHGHALPSDLHRQWLSLLLCISTELELSVRCQFTTSLFVDAGFSRSSTLSFQPEASLQVASVWSSRKAGTRKDSIAKIRRTLASTHSRSDYRAIFDSIGQDMTLSYVDVIASGDSRSDPAVECFAATALVASTCTALHAEIIELLCSAAAVHDKAMQSSDAMAGTAPQTRVAKSSREVRISTFGRQTSSAPPGVQFRHVFKCEKISNPSSSSRKGRTGLDRRLRKEVMATPGAEKLVNEAVARILRDVASSTPNESVSERYGFRCAMGKHRSVSIAEEVASRLHHAAKELRHSGGVGFDVNVTHHALEALKASSGRSKHGASKGRNKISKRSKRVAAHDLRSGLDEASHADHLSPCVAQNCALDLGEKWPLCRLLGVSIPSALRDCEANRACLEHSEDWQCLDLLELSLTRYVEDRFVGFLQISTVLLERWLRGLFCHYNEHYVDLELVIAKIGKYFATLDGYGQRHLHQVIILPTIHSTALRKDIRCNTEYHDANAADGTSPNKLLHQLSPSQHNFLNDIFLMPAGPALRAKLAHGWTWADRRSRRLPTDSSNTFATDQSHGAFERQLPPCPVATFMLALLCSLLQREGGRILPTVWNARPDTSSLLFKLATAFEPAEELSIQDDVGTPQQSPTWQWWLRPGANEQLHLFSSMFYHQFALFRRHLTATTDALNWTCAVLAPNLPRLHSDECPSDDCTFLVSPILATTSFLAVQVIQRSFNPIDIQPIRVVVKSKSFASVSKTAQQTAMVIATLFSKLGLNDATAAAHCETAHVDHVTHVGWKLASSVSLFNGKKAGSCDQNDLNETSIAGASTIVSLKECEQLLRHLRNHIRNLSAKAVARTARTGQRNTLVSFIYLFPRVLNLSACE